MVFTGIDPPPYEPYEGFLRIRLNRFKLWNWIDNYDWVLWFHQILVTTAQKRTPSPLLRAAPLELKGSLHCPGWARNPAVKSVFCDVPQNRSGEFSASNRFCHILGFAESSIIQNCRQCLEVFIVVYCRPGSREQKKLQWPPMVGFGVPKKLRKMQRQAQDHAFRGMQVQLMSQIDETWKSVEYLETGNVNGGTSGYKHRRIWGFVKFGFPSPNGKHHHHHHHHQQQHLFGVVILCVLTILTMDLR